MKDPNSISRGVVIVGYGFTSSSGPAQDTSLFTKREGSEEDWWHDKSEPMIPFAALPENASEVPGAVKQTMVKGIPEQVMLKIMNDLGNDPGKKFKITITSYQAIEHGKVTPAVRLKFEIGAIINAANNTITGSLTGDATIETFNSKGVNESTRNIKCLSGQVTS